MAANIVRTQTSAVHFTLLSDDVVPKNIENKLSISAKCDDAAEDDVFANENETSSIHISKDQQPNGPDNTEENDQNRLNANVTCCSVGEVSSPDAQVVSSPTVPATTSTTTRRPSYTSKAPSALTNLPKTIDEIQNSPNSTLQSFGLNTVDLLEKRPGSSSGFEQDGIRSSSAKELLSLHAQASFESLDEYSNPGTPTPNAHSPSNAQISRHREKVRLRAEVISQGKLESAVQAPVLAVKCRDKIGELHKMKFGSGSKGKCIKVQDKWYAPIEFEALAGRASCKDWKRSIRFHGYHLQKLIEDNYLTLHAISCTCGICCGDETLTGPVKLFQSIKRKRSLVNNNNNLLSSPGPMKRKSMSDELKYFRDRTGSYSVDGDVFVLGGDDTGMPPMTPLTPMTPITPHTPFGANCLTPLPTTATFRPNSPPKSITLQVPLSQNVSVVGSMKQDFEQMQHMMPPPGSAKSDMNILSQQHWIHLEEMATNLVTMANKMKLMVEQVKIQSEAMKDSAVTQAKIQAENDKAEAISLLRRGQIQHAMHAIPISVASEQMSLSQNFTIQVSKVCQNCGREAFLECTGCNKSYYCGQFCQQRDWVTHKSKCREMAEDNQQNHHTTADKQ